MSTPYTETCKTIERFRTFTEVPVHIEKTENFDFFEALASEYDVLYKILSYLSYKDLRNVAKLSEIWASNVDAILRKRLSPVLFSLSPICYNIPEPFDINPSLCVVFNELNNEKPMKLNTYICVHNNEYETKKPVIEFLENDLLSAQCPIASLTCRQITSSFTLSRNFNGLVFPTIPNVKMSVFRVTESRKNLRELLEENIGKDNNLVCLLTYGLCVKNKNIKGLISAIQDRQPLTNFAFGGGYVRGMQAFNYFEKKSPTVYKRTDLLCVAFSKPKNLEVPFNAYSIIIREHATTEEEIAEYLIKLKTNFIPRKYGIIFRITCVSRQEEINKEINLLNKYFPCIEVLGFSGDGEIGWDCYNDSDDTGETEAKKKKVNQNLLHELTTIIVLLSWGKKR